MTRNPNPTSRRQFIGHAAALAAAWPALGVAQGGYPQRAITIVVPLSAGGVTDVVARYLAQKLSDEWKVPVVIENKLGAGGGVGAEYVARARPDGYTLVMGTVSSHAINASLYQALRYDNLRDFEPVSLAASGPNMLVVHPSLPVKTVAELVQHLKAHPGAVSYGSTGVGTSTHVLAELFKMTTGTQMTHVPYKGSSQMMTDLVAGQVHLAFDNMPTALVQARAGKLRPLGISSAGRWADTPEIPAIAETLPGFVATSWQGLFAPAGTPPEALDRLSAEVQRVLKAPETVRRFQDLGTNAAGMPREDFRRFVREETERWAAVVRKSGARADG
jgi:tripartite-type tricarboxylate transporter receptor subunit TctC